MTTNKSISFATVTAPNAEQIAFPVSMVNAKGKVKQAVDQTSYQDLTEDGYKVQEVAPSTPRSTTGKQRISKAQAKAMSDANLSESFGLPSALASQVIGYQFEVKVEDFISQPKRNGSGLFPSTQVSFNNVRFCILFDDRHEVGQSLDCILQDAGLRPDGTPVTRSGKTVEVQY